MASMGNIRGTKGSDFQAKTGMARNRGRGMTEFAKEPDRQIRAAFGQDLRP